MNECRIKYFCPWWGLDHLGLKPMLRAIKTWGYDGVEIGIPKTKREQQVLKALLEDLELDVVAHHYQAEGSFKAYQASFGEWLERAAAFHPLKINSHTGRDYWSVRQNSELVALGAQVTARYGIDIVHETHRGRFLYSLPQSGEYFRRLPGLRITADLSHWVCVSESLLAEQQPALDIALRRTGHIHARVGHAQGPQVPKPFGREWASELTTFLGWWRRIYEYHREAGATLLTITPECGPYPYAPSRTNQERQWAINAEMMAYLRRHLG